MNALGTSQILVDYDAALARVALATVVETVPALGRPPSRGLVAAVLTGSLRQDVLKCDGHRLITFGVLAHLRAQDVLGMLDKLLAAELLTKAPTKNGLVLSAKGRSLLERDTGGTSAPFGLIPGIVDSQRLDQPSVPGCSTPFAGFARSGHGRRMSRSSSFSRRPASAIWRARFRTTRPRSPMFRGWGLNEWRLMARTC